MGRRRRTSGIQRRERASSEALNRRLDEGGAPSALPDWRLLAIGGLLVVGLLVVVLVLVFGSGPDPNTGSAQPNAGQAHVTDGFNCRSAPESCGVTGAPYTSLPATSGPHWGTPANWGVYSTPQSESQVIHNLEHGGLVIWYRAGLDAEQVADLAGYVDAQVAQSAGRFKFILSPWGGEEELTSPIVVTAWRHLLPLDTADTGAIDAFARQHYGQAPEPLGGPGPPG